MSPRFTRDSSLKEKLPTYFINNADNILDSNSIRHFSLHEHSEKVTHDFLPSKEKVTIAITSGASCPDAVVEGVIFKLMEIFSVEMDMLTGSTD